MTALVVDGELDFNEFCHHLVRRLPPYARPLFPRITNQIDATSTFKHTKSDLQRDGCDPAVTRNRILLR